MLLFLLRKVLRVGAILFGVTLIMFLLMHMIPGNPWSSNAGERPMLPGMDIDPATLRELNRRFGLDLPLWRQFTRYMVGDDTGGGRFTCGLVCGNLGPSLVQRGRTVQDVLFEPPKGLTFWHSRVGYSLRLVFFGSLITAGLGIPLGIVSAAKPRSLLSRAISVGLAGLISIPNFVLGLLAVIVLASWLQLIPVLPDWDEPAHWIVPAVVLAVMPMANLARVTRVSLTNLLQEDFVRTARAKGLTQKRVMLVHVFRNALAPILTFLGPTLIEMFVGLFVVETLYSFPGFGQLYWSSVLRLDYALILGLTVVYATGIAVVNIVVDFLVAVLDPRIYSAQQGLV